jgi:hypothetical protein
VIEILTFHLRADMTEAEFLAADRGVQMEFAYHQPGLMRRTTARGTDGEWVVLDLWRSDDDADESDRRWATDPVAQHFMSFVDPKSVHVRRYATLD